MATRQREVSQEIMDIIGANLQALKQRITDAAAKYDRNPALIQVLAVSKTFGAGAIRAAYALGQRAFGENYVQEALEKVRTLSDLDIEWHFVGPIQSNKTRAIAENFSWVHSVDRLKIAKRLSTARPANLAPLQVCIQVHIGGEQTKGGIDPDQASSLARAIQSLPGLCLRGLMAVPPASTDFATQRGYFSQLGRLQQALLNEGMVLDSLSMGMSQDLEAAIAEGATMVRIGTAIFGARARHR